MEQLLLRWQRHPLEKWVQFLVHYCAGSFERLCWCSGLNCGRWGFWLQLLATKQAAYWCDILVIQELFFFFFQKISDSGESTCQGIGVALDHDCSPEHANAAPKIDGYKQLLVLGSSCEELCVDECWEGADYVLSSNWSTQFRICSSCEEMESTSK